MIVHTGRSMLEGKVAGFIFTGNDSGSLLAIAHMMAVINSMGVHIPAWALAYHHTVDDALEDKQAVRDSYNVGYIVTIVAKMLNERKEWYNPRVDIDELRKIAIEKAKMYESQKVERLKLFNEKTRK